AGARWWGPAAWSGRTCASPLSASAERPAWGRCGPLAARVAVEDVVPCPARRAPETVRGPIPRRSAGPGLSRGLPAGADRARSEVDHVPREAVDRLLDGLGQRRVRVHVARDLVDGEVPLLRERELGQELGRVGADEVAAEELAVRRVGDELDEPGRVAEAVRLAVRHEREGRDLDVVALVARLLLGETEARDLRLAERRARHHAVVAEREGLGAADGLGRDDALRLRDVREHELRGDVADRVDVLDVGAHDVVDRDGAALGELDAGVLEAEALDVGGEADGHEHLVDDELARLVVLDALVA